MSKKTNSRLYAIVDANNTATAAALKDALAPYAPKYREGKKIVFDQALPVLFIEPRRREEQMVGTLEHLVILNKICSCHVIEENKNLQSLKSSTEGNCRGFVAEIAVMNFSAPQESFSQWQEIFRAVAKKIYQENGVSLSLNVYYRKQDGTVHAICSDDRLAGETASEDERRLEEKKWKDAVCKMAVALGSEPQFRSVYCSCI